MATIEFKGKTYTGEKITILNDLVYVDDVLIEDKPRDLTQRVRTHFDDGDPVNFPPEFLCGDGEWHPVYFLERTAKGEADINQRSPDKEEIESAQLRLADYHNHLYVREHRPVGELLARAMIVFHNQITAADKGNTLLFDASVRKIFKEICDHHQATKK